MKLNDICKRHRVVVHHTHLLGNNILKSLSTNDIVFFDDCLYSQYIFIKQHHKFFIDNNIDCILGFSSGLYANEDSKQIYDIESSCLHNECNIHIKTLNDANVYRNKLSQMNGFMKLSQLKELLKLDNMHLALHGCCHLNLNNKPGILNKMLLFKQDIDDGIKQLKMFELSTNMFIYPYVQSFYSSDSLLRKCGFTSIIGSSVFRYAIENLASNQLDAKCDC